MAQYLDLNGLHTVVDNIKNIKSPVCLPAYKELRILQFGTTIKNDKAPSYTAVIYDLGTACFVAQYDSKTYYTKWGANAAYLSYDKYGTPTTHGVQPKVGYLYVGSSDSTLQVCFQTGKLTRIANYTPQPSWTTVTTSPFIKDDYLKAVQRQDTGNDTYLWKVTIKNIDSEDQLFNVQNVSTNDLLQFAAYLTAGQEATFTMELSKTVPNNYLSVTF